MREALAQWLGPDLELDAPLARHTSLRVGGPVDALVRPRSADQLRELLARCREHALPIHALGRGFNTLVRDGGLRGVAVQLSRLAELRWDEHGSLWAEAGVTHSAIARHCAEAGRSGLEFAVGIPGCVGGWAQMNAGTREREMKDVVREIHWMDAAGELHVSPARELRWRYRALELPPGAFVLGARFETEPADRESVRRAQRAQLDRRRATQPVNQPSCGSVFRNPSGDHAGRLIEAAGLKGARCGRAEISDVHANFIVTQPGARAADVLELIERAREAVRERFGIALETEVEIVGEAL